MTDLIERLENGAVLCWNEPATGIATLIEEAVDALEARDAEITRLRKALESIAYKTGQMADDRMQSNRGLWDACRNQARAALTGKDDPA